MSAAAKGMNMIVASIVSISYVETVRLVPIRYFMRRGIVKGHSRDVVVVMTNAKETLPFVMSVSVAVAIPAGMPASISTGSARSGLISFVMKKRSVGMAINSMNVMYVRRRGFFRWVIMSRKSIFRQLRKRMNSRKCSMYGSNIMPMEGKIRKKRFHQ